MLFYLYHLKNIWGPFRLFEYVTFRAAGAAATALILTLLLSPLVISLLKKLKTQNVSRYEGILPDKFLDKEKEKTPSMGGVLITFNVIVATLLWARPVNHLTYVFILTIFSFALIGFLDDFRKMSRQKGISAKLKLILQILVGFTAILYLNIIIPEGININELMVPFIKTPVLTGIAGFLVTFPLAILVVVGASNAVNLTDGKDGLAIGCVIFCALAYALFSYLTGNIIFSNHLDIRYIPGAGEIGIFSAGIIGASLGFLWYNCYPASIFMGDTGSLALGGSVGLISVLVRQELTLLIVGGVFVMEASSVIIQIIYYKITGKKFFLCTPIHHHFEQKGWTETQIVVRFWILGVVFALIGLTTLKLR